jgi:outer membrane biosynthesis protein TonB
LQLTDEQVETARALGCRFIPASEAQVRQFSMQRRVFQIGGQPFLAARADGFYETAGTLMAQVAEAIKQREETAPPAPVEVEEPEPPGIPEPLAEEAPPAPITIEVEVEVAPEPDAPAPARVEALQEVVVPTASHRLSQPVGESTAVMAAMVTIAKGYVRGHDMNSTQLSALISTVHRSLSGLRRH